MILFVRGANPIWYFVDLIGLGLNDEYYIFFLTNTLPYIPQIVTHDPEGLIPWSNPIEFYPNGTLPDNMYFDGSLTYRIEVRRGPTQADPLIYEINDWVPGVSFDENIDHILTAENQITNPQFESVNFFSTPSTPYIYTQAAPGSYQVDVAPGWTLYLTGQGTTKLTQIEIPGSGIVGNPPYALEIENLGWTTAILAQRFERNGAIFAGGAVSMYALFRPYIVTQDVTLAYVPSGGTAPSSPIAFAPLPAGVFTALKGTLSLNPSDNTDTGDSAYVDMQIILQGTGKIDITNVQVVGQSVPLSDNFDPLVDSPIFQEETIEREIDNQFHYYADSLITQPKSSILTGWNFPLNPYQFNTTTIVNQAAQTSYIADQTILYQQATANNIMTGVSTLDTSGGLELIPNPGSGLNGSQFALIQYIDPQTALPYWGTILSSLVKARVFLGAGNATKIPIKARLIYRGTLPNVLSDTDPISSWTLGGDPVFAAGWTAVAPLNDPAYILPNSYVSGSVEEYPSFSFDQFKLPVATTGTMTLGIVIYTMNSMVPTGGRQDAIVFKSISLVKNDFAIETQAETYDESFRKCQFYYEKSYTKSVLPGAITNAGIRYTPNPLGGDYSSTVMYKSTFNLVFDQIKRGIPVVTFYNGRTGAANFVDMDIWTGTAYPGSGIGTNPLAVAISEWSSITTNQTNIVMRPNDSSPKISFNTSPGSSQGELYFHYVADARLGV